ncbi:MAG: hypothetical protein AAB540_00450 [Patescibacteria group bacterium]
MTVSLGAPRVVSDSNGAEKQPSRIITISEPGYYRMGKGVHTVTCLNGKFTIVDCGGMGSLFQGSIYAPAAKESQWIYVTSEMLVAGPLQFEVFCLGDAQGSELLVRDEEKGNAVDEVTERMRVGVSVEAEKVRGGWSRGC